MTCLRKPDKGEFRFCPNCGSDEIEQTDYELEDGTEDTAGRACTQCRWEGDRTELVCKEKL